MSVLRCVAVTACVMTCVIPPPRAPMATPALAQVDAARISLAEFKRRFDAGDVVVVDTRDADSYRAGHIPGALLVPQGTAASKAAELKAAGKLVVTYCT